MKGRRVKILSYAVITYMLLAFGWWSVLLYTKNQDAFLAKSNSLQYKLAAEGRIRSEAEFIATLEYQELARRYTQQKYMIFGEGAFIVISLLVGLYMVSQSLRKEMQTARQQRNFLLSITHELKSPIASIRLVLETLLKRDGLPRGQVETLSRNAIRESDRLHRLVNDLLLAARMERTLQLNREAVRIYDLLQEARRKVCDDHPDVACIIGAGVEPLPEGYYDPFALKTVFLNLLENAAKYSAPPAHIEINASVNKNSLVLTFADRGFGVPKHERNQIFRKFYRIGNEDTRETKGTGLGLYIVSEIIKAHQGHIEVRDNPGGGSIFELTLPLPHHSSDNIHPWTESSWSKTKKVSATSSS
jgi:two-component system phosphate regulon sensor histidine kinase PhoR